MFRHFGTLPAFDGWMHNDSIYFASIASRGKAALYT